MLPDSLSSLVDAKLTDCNYVPKGRESGRTIFHELPPITTTIDNKDILAIDNLDNSPELKVLQQEDAY